MGVLLCALIFGVHYSYKTVQDRFLLAKNKIEAGKSTIHRIAGLSRVMSPVIHEGDMNSSNFNLDKSPAPFAEMNEAEIVIVVPEIERSAGVRKKAAIPTGKNKCSAIAERESCEHNKSECCTKKAGLPASSPAVIKANESKKKPGSTRKSGEISEQKHFGVGLKFTV